MHICTELQKNLNIGIQLLPEDKSTTVETDLKDLIKIRSIKVHILKRANARRISTTRRLISAQVKTENFFRISSHRHLSMKKGKVSSQHTRKYPEYTTKSSTPLEGTRRKHGSQVVLKQISEN